MQRKFLLPGLLVAFLCLAASAALADHCKPVHVRLGEMTFREPGCIHNGEAYVWCADRPTMGTLKGTYYFYSRPELNGWDLEVEPGVLSDTDTWWLGVSHVLAVFDTNKGKVFAQECEIWHWGEEEGYGAHVSITGGTGKYENATGWMAFAGTLKGGIIIGEICTP